MSDDPHLPAPAHPTPAPSADAEPRSVEPYQPAAPTYGRAWRVMFAFVAVMCFFAAAVLGLGASWIAAASMIVFGGGAGYFAITGRRPADPSLAPGSARFHELADPSRPLPARVPPPDPDRPPSGES